jgi:hypothetical protein
VRLIFEWGGWRLSYGDSVEQHDQPADPGSTTSYPLTAGELDEDTSTFGLR